MKKENKNRVVTLNERPAGFQGLPQLSCLLPLRNGVRGRFQIKFGMTPNFMGFTLIELLVVILIIGVLSAVALPQYQKAVIRSRSRTMLSLGKTLSTAKEVYYLANGQYTADMRLLDVELPGSCTMLTNNGHYYKCGNYFLLDNNADHLVIDYCPENNGSYADCQPQRIFSFMFVAEHRTSLDLPSGIYCNVHNNSVVGQQICNMEIGAGMSFRSISY